MPIDASGGFKLEPPLQRDDLHSRGALARGGSVPDVLDDLLTASPHVDESGGSEAA